MTGASIFTGGFVPGVPLTGGPAPPSPSPSGGGFVPSFAPQVSGIGLKLVKPGTSHAYTAYRETDARTALTRGLAEYLMSLKTVGKGGRPLAFKKAFDTWADAENSAEYPSMYVSHRGEGTYDASRLTPGGITRIKAPDKRSLIASSELMLDIAAEVWCTDRAERMALVAMLEDACLAPFDSAYGMQIDLPHYFNARARYEVLGVAYSDSESDVAQRQWRATISARGHMTVLRLADFAYADIKTKIEVDDE